MDLYPAIDLRGGRCVRLYQGDYDRETVYGDDPVGQARAFADAGAPWIHVVDLDAARSGEPVNRPVVAAIAGSVGTPVQTGGGVRDEAAAEALLEAGVARVVIGTAALEQPELVHRLAGRWPGQVALGLDVRGARWRCAAGPRARAGSCSTSSREFADAGVAALVVTADRRRRRRHRARPRRATPSCSPRPSSTSSRPAASARSTTCATSRRSRSAAVTWPAPSSAGRSTTARFTVDDALAATTSVA